MLMMKKCSKCGELKSESDFRLGRGQCKKCEYELSKSYKKQHEEETKEYNKEYYKKNLEKTKKNCKDYREQHREELILYNKNYREQHQEEINLCSKNYRKTHRKELAEKQRQKRGSISMYKNKLCSNYLGIVIAERLCKHLFKDVKMMPYGNTGYDIICNRGKKIDVKSSCIRLSKDNKYINWGFKIRKNIIADFFICVSFDNRNDLNPLHMWMIPGSEVNHLTKISISPSTIHKWNKCKRNISDAQLCCSEMKKGEI